MSRTERFTMLLTDQEKTFWNEKALEKGFDSLSAYIRWEMNRLHRLETNQTKLEEPKNEQDRTITG